MVDRPAGSSRVPEVSVHDLAGRDTAASCVIDVRTHREYVDGHVPGAQLLPLHVLVGDETEVLTAGLVYVICGAGPRSVPAVEHLRSRGIDAVVVRGGTRAWVDAGFPLEQEGTP